MLSVMQMTHIAVTLCMVLVSTTSAYAWYPYGDRYMQWQKSRPLMYGALHNSVPEDQMLSRVARFKAAGLNTVAWWKPGNASICLKLRIVWVLDGRVGLLVVVRPFMRR